MNKAVIYLHGKGGSSQEAAHYRSLFPDCEVIGYDYKAETPWDAKDEFSRYFDGIFKNYEEVTLAANSIGAFFAMSALPCQNIKRAFFISPIVDMRNLIETMMQWAGITEEELRARRRIDTAFGESLSWDYLTYVRTHPLIWTADTHILYGERDAMTSYETISAFAAKTGADLTILPGGEHWFHTDAQMDFLDRWIKRLR